VKFQTAVFALAIPAFMLLAGCGDDDDAGSGTVETATLKDFSISLQQPRQSAGQLTFKIHNDGPSQHEFVVVKTDAAASALPYDQAKNQVNEDSSELKAIDEKEAIDSGKDAQLSVNLDAGHYVVFCNLPTHYQLGMHAEFTVS
jgi:uncharacterized cupredoxin-like copper-binding protein